MSFLGKVFKALNPIALVKSLFKKPALPTPPPVAAPVAAPAAAEAITPGSRTATAQTALSASAAPATSRRKSLLASTMSSLGAGFSKLGPQ